MIEVDEKQVLRSYTPTSNDFDKGYFELVIKVNNILCFKHTLIP